MCQTSQLTKEAVSCIFHGFYQQWVQVLAVNMSPHIVFPTADRQLRGAFSTSHQAGCNQLPLDNWGSLRP